MEDGVPFWTRQLFCCSISGCRGQPWAARILCDQLDGPFAPNPVAPKRFPGQPENDSSDGSTSIWSGTIVTLPGSAPRSDTFFHYMEALSPGMALSPTTGCTTLTSCSCTGLEHL